MWLSSGTESCLVDLRALRGAGRGPCCVAVTLLDSHMHHAPEGTRSQLHPAWPGRPLRWEFERSWPQCATGGGEGQTSSSSSNHLQTGARPAVQLEKPGLQRLSHLPGARGVVWWRVCLSYSPAPHKACLVPSGMPGGKLSAPHALLTEAGRGSSPEGGQNQRTRSPFRARQDQPETPPGLQGARLSPGRRLRGVQPAARLAPHWPEAAGAAEALAVVGGIRAV